MSAREEEAVKEEVVEMDEDDLQDVIPQSTRARGSTVPASSVPVSVALSSVEGKEKKTVRKRGKSPAPKSALLPSATLPSEVAPNSPRNSMASKRSRTSGASKKESLKNGQGGQPAGVEDSEEVGPLDSEMAKVQEKLGGAPQVCLRALDVGRFLQGEKLGVRVVAASRLDLIFVHE